jgi:type II secretory pathway component GspD/PulD (secretin)
MKRTNLVFFSAAIIALSVAAIVRAQDPFGAPAAAPPSASQPTAAVNSSPNPAPTELLIDNMCRCEGEANLAAIAKINMALNTPLRGSGLDFSDTPLEEVVNLLQDDFDIPIQIDIPALDEIGVGSDEPVNINLRNISLRSALRLMLKQHQLTFIVDDEVLLITTPDEADSRIKVCVYDVRDLVDGNAASALDELTDVVTSSVSADSWAQSGGGRGSVRSYPPNLLIISQSQGVHQQIQDLLKRMRQMRQPARGNDNPLPAPTPRK